MQRLFTSESVTSGHPDKLADQISDSLLDAFLAQDPKARVACEVLVNTGLVVVGGEVSTTGYVDIPSVVRETIVRVGYDAGELLFDGRSCAVMVTLDEQSPEIAQGVDEYDDHEQGAGDQGLMFGYACDHTEEYMPLPITLAHQMAQRLERVRQDGTLPFLRPDGKTQVTFALDEQGAPMYIDAVVVSAQHSPEAPEATLREGIVHHVIKPVCHPWLRPETKMHINPTGSFVIGGPHADCGLTGRKIIVDTYGGWARHGGGAFSGKDPSKVDRSGAYMARYIAKNLVAHGLCRQCEVQLSYAIGVVEPVGIYIEDFGTATVPQAELLGHVQRTFDLTPKGIITQLDLLRPLYAPTAAYGHFGRPELDLPWERIIDLK